MTIKTSRTYVPTIFILALENNRYSRHNIAAANK